MKLIKFFILLFLAVAFGVNAATTTTEVPSGVEKFYDKTLLSRIKPQLQYAKFGMKKSVPSRQSKVIKMRRYGVLAVATTPLTEGTTPAGSQLSTTDIEATLYQYGDFVTITDLIDLLVEDPILTEAAEVLGDQAALTLDTLDRDILVAGSALRYAGGVAARTDIITKITTTDIDIAIRALRRANAKYFTEIIKASTGVGTTPIRAAFFGVCHPDMTRDLEAMTGWVPVNQYANTSAIYENEVGAYKSIRFVESTNASMVAGAGATVASSGLKFTTMTGPVDKVDVYKLLIFAKEAYGVIDHSSNSVQNIVKTYGSAGSSDPLNQRATSGWKVLHTCKILNDSWMFRIEAGVTV